MADLSARGHPKYPLFSWTPRLWAHSHCWLVAGMHHGPPSLQGPCWVAREGRMQSSIWIQRCHCRKPLPSPGTHGFRKLDTDGTHALTWPREEESGNSPSGSHWLEPGHVVCAVFLLRGAGILDHPRASLSICLTRLLVSHHCQAHLQAAARRSLIKCTPDYAILLLGLLLPGSHCFQDIVQAS